jgi:NTE family protein
VRNYEFVALVFQGGGALGSYQAGVFEGLSEAGIEPNWMSGVSIGAINASIIAGNKPEDRVAKLKEFWETVTDHGYASHLAGNDDMRTFHNMTSAFMSMISGIPGFYKPRMLSPWQQVPGQAGATSHYDTSDLKDHLNSLIDWDILNSNSHRLSVGAVNVRTGNYKYFDTALERLGPEHIMASGALPPAFPAMKIGSEFYWDGGIVSNTPLQYVLDERDGEGVLVFQVDLFSARGMMPRSLAEAEQREKDIRFSSRTRLNTDMQKRIEQLEAAALRLAEKLPPELRNDADVAALTARRADGPVTILHLINRSESYETQHKDYEFSRGTIDGHWADGKRDVERSLASPQWKRRARPEHGIVTLDLA